MCDCRTNLSLFPELALPVRRLLIALGEHGFKPTLVERASRLRTSGYVIDFWGLGYDIAERMGLLSGLKSEGYDVQEVRFVNAEGRREGGFGVDIFRSLTDGRYVSIARSDLAKLIYHKIDGRAKPSSVTASSALNEPAMVWMLFSNAAQHAGSTSLSEPMVFTRQSAN